MGRSTGSLGLALALLLVATTACHREQPLGPELIVEDMHQQLDAELTGTRRELVDPGDALRGDGAREGVVIAPGTQARARVTLPERAALRFGVGVAGDKRRDATRTGIRFTLAVDGERRFSRVINPAAERHDRRWFDERIDLAAYAGRTVELALGVEAESPDRPPAGAAAWSRVRIVQTSTVARQREVMGHPNLVVVVVDTLRADALGLYGGPPGSSPTLDALGARGTVFVNAVSQASWTLPSVASLLSGLAPRSHGAIGEVERADRHPHARWGFLADRVTTWAEAAARAGITTFGVSANPLVSSGTNLAQGFETFVELPWDPEGRNWATADQVNAAFLAWLPRRTGHRFAAYLHYMEPHDPYTPPDPPPPPAGARPSIAGGWVRGVADRVNWAGRDALSPVELDYLRRCYQGEVRAWDRALSGLLAGLAQAGLAETTTIVVTADHGEEFQEHGRLTHGSHLYDESIRVPLVLAGAGVPVARRSDLAQGIDLFPTVAHLLGVIVSTLPGRDLLAAETERAAILETASGIAPDGRRVDVIAVRTAAWKLIQTPALERTELYDLHRDPHELTSRGLGTPEAGALQAHLDSWRATTPVAIATGPGDPTFAARLRALGYAQ